MERSSLGEQQQQQKQKQQHFVEEAQDICSQSSVQYIYTQRRTTRTIWTDHVHLSLDIHSHYYIILFTELRADVTHNTQWIASSPVYITQSTTRRSACLPACLSICLAVLDWVDQIPCWTAWQTLSLSVDPQINVSRTKNTPPMDEMNSPPSPIIIIIIITTTGLVLYYYSYKHYQHQKECSQRYSRAMNLGEAWKEGRSLKLNNKFK